VPPASSARFHAYEARLFRCSFLTEMNVYTVHIYTHRGKNVQNYHLLVQPPLHEHLEAHTALHTHEVLLYYCSLPPKKGIFVFSFSNKQRAGPGRVQTSEMLSRRKSHDFDSVSKCLQNLSRKSILFGKLIATRNQKKNAATKEVDAKTMESRCED
jgi:hypothetical protein